MPFVNCPVCGRPMVEQPDQTEFHFHCARCNRDYLYEEGTLIDLGTPGGEGPRGGDEPPPGTPKK